MFSVKTVAILAGGPSSEHAISLNTAKNVLAAIDRKKFRPTLIFLTKKLKLFRGKQRINFADLVSFDVVFNALHGAFGEDGTLQSILEQHGISYTGSRAKASALGMDKWKSKLKFKKAGLRVPKAKLYRSKTDLQKIGLPCVIKHRFGGSSIDTYIVNSKKESAAIMPRLTPGNWIVEDLIPGNEFAVGVLEIKGKPCALPVIEISPKQRYAFFNYEAKYKTGASTEIVPARISHEFAKKLQRAGLAAHRLIGASGYSRSDFIVKNGIPFILEINTLPGLTANSLLPKAVKAAGISFSDLITKIIEAS